MERCVLWELKSDRVRYLNFLRANCESQSADVRQHNYLTERGRHQTRDFCIAKNIGVFSQTQFFHTKLNRSRFVLFNSIIFLRNNSSLRMIPLRCAVKKYDWGKKGKSSMVAQIVHSQDSSIKVDSDTPYAELWMGTHPSGPSVLPKQNDETLLSYLSKYPEYAGNIQIVSKYGRNLPFLFKVLSVRTALSIQAHPNKELAEKLHREAPSHYPDANHKPELAIALTEFEAFCGFRPVSEIETLLSGVPEFKATVGSDAATKFASSPAGEKKQALGELFSALMNSEGDLVKRNLASLKTRWSAAPKEAANATLETQRKLFLKLSADFPDDIGLFGVFLLNYIILQPGEAVYMGQNEPHAYISGDCVECMACSDNVVRAGLTPKFKDVKTLCDMLTYHSAAPSEQCLQALTVDQYTRSYIVPVPDFVVDAIEIRQEDLVPSFEYKLEAKESGSILIVIKGDATVGEGERLSPGYVGFIPAVTSLQIRDVMSPMFLYRAYCRLDD